MHNFLSHWFDSTTARIPQSIKVGDRRLTHSAILSGLQEGLVVVLLLVVPWLIEKMGEFSVYAYCGKVFAAHVRWRYSLESAARVV